jgi:hypothetical protein
VVQQFEQLPSTCTTGTGIYIVSSTPLVWSLNTHLTDVDHASTSISFPARNPLIFVSSSQF